MKTTNKQYPGLRYGCLMISCLLVLASVNMVWAGQDITAYKLTDQDVTIDGRADEGCWSQATVITGFMQHDPVEQAVPSESTRVRLAYSRTHLYVMAELRDSRPERIVRVLTRRDRHSDADNFSIDIDSYHDRRNGFRFQVNAGGTTAGAPIFMRARRRSSSTGVRLPWPTTTPGMSASRK